MKSEFDFKNELIVVGDHVSLDIVTFVLSGGGFAKQNDEDGMPVFIKGGIRATYDPYSGVIWLKYSDVSVRIDNVHLVEEIREYLEGEPL